VLEGAGWADNLPYLLQRQNIYKDILIFIGPPITDDIIISGYAEVVLWVTSSLEFTDFHVKLLDYDSEKK